MKNTRQPQFTSGVTGTIKTGEGTLHVPVLSYVRFNEFLSAGATNDTYIQDPNDLDNPYTVAEGIPNEGGAFAPSTGLLSDFNIYGSTIYTDVTTIDGAKVRVPMSQRGFSLPLSGLNTGGTEAIARKFIVSENAGNLDPHALTPGTTEPDKITYMFKLRMNPGNAKALFQVGVPNSNSSLSIGFSDVNTLEIRNNAASGSPATQSINISSIKDRWVTLFAQAYRATATSIALDAAYIFDTSTGELLATAGSTSSSGTTTFSLSNPNAYIGYGEYSGGLNQDFLLSDFLIGVDIAEFAAFAKGFDATTIERIAKSHLAENQFKSGFNNRAPRKVQQMLDARRTYPISANPARGDESAAAFDDMTTEVFGQAPPSRYLELDPLKSLQYDPDALNTGITSKPGVWIASGAGAGNIERTTANININGIDSDSIEVIKGTNSSWRITSRSGADRLPPGSYKINFKLGIGSEGTHTSSDILDLRLWHMDLNTYTQVDRFVLDSGIPTLMGGSNLSKFERSYDITITENDLLQWVRFSGNESVYLWDIELTWQKPDVNLVFPEMLPETMLSGSVDVYGYTTGRGAPGDTQPFYRDIHNTPLEKRLTAPGHVRPGLAHEETLLFNKASRNSPVSLSKDTSVLGGTIAPFNDASPQIRLANERAVSAGTIDGFDQRVGDRVAIVIELDPSEETTIGVERKPDGNATGRITSMAYYNFDTKKWETSGANNDFVIPGAITISTSSAAAYPGAEPANYATISGDEPTPARCEYEILRNSAELLNSASVGFTGTSGFTIYPNLGQNALSDLKNRALPTSNYGFPRHKKYEPKVGQKIKMSDYISAPFVVERVSFEYGAAIEESGPHSLGYKLPFISTENPDYMMLYPQTYHKVSNWNASLDTDNGPGTADYSCVRRGEYINGSKVINLGDPESGFTDTPFSFGNEASAPINMMINSARIAGGPRDFGSTNKMGYFRVYDGTGTTWDGAANSPQILFANEVAHPRLNPETTTGLTAGKDYSLMTLTASMFLKTSTGPRTAAEDPSKRQLSDWTTGRIKPVSVIPVLAGGLNGVVTGSWTAVGLNFKDPALGLLTNDADNGSDDTNRSWYSSEGGTPFWRADTFFLLKEKNKPDRHDEMTIKIVGSSWAPIFCGAPFLSETGIGNTDGVQADNDVYSANSPAFIGTLYSQFRIIGSGPEGGSDLMIKNIWRYGARTSTAPLKSGRETFTDIRAGTDADGNVLVDVGSRSATTRELVTFGQMTHYGYANAATEITGTLVDSTSPYQPSDPTAAAGLSGSIDGTFATQLSTNSSLHTQALKITSLIGDYAFSSIPSNIEHVYDVNKDAVSAFSDFPDTCQSQFSPPQDAQSETGLYSFRLSPAGGESYTDFTTPGWTDPAPSWPFRQAPSGPNPRYAASGSVNSLYGEYNETFISLDTWADPLVLTRAGVRPGNPPYEQTAKYSCFTQFTSSISPTYLPEPAGINEPQQGGTTYSPVGSGWSLISTPSHIASEKRLNVNYLTGSMAEDFARFGSFTSSSIDWQSSLGKKFPSAPRKSWLDSGLSRDLNIFLQPGQRHEGTNIDFADNFCGFTIMTASTAQRPLESPGRESAALPLQANVYKRQYLNYSNNFKIDVPVRADVPRTAETPGYWTFTANNYRTEIGTYQSANPEFSYLGFSSVFPDIKDRIKPNSSITADNTLRTWQRAIFAKRYHLRYSIMIGEGGWDPDILKSTSRYIRGVTARDPEQGTAQSALGLPGMTTFTAGGRSGSDASIISKLFSIDDTDASGLRPVQCENAYTNAQSAATTSGSFAKDPTVDSMYVLEPEDELILGVQPALPGWNPGTGLPNNRHSSKYGIWDVSGSTTAGYAKAWDVDDDGLVIENPYMNLEDPYEPCHGLTMLKTPSRVVLYGTFVKDNKPYSNSSTQIIGSDAVHEAIHYDNPILDQFSIANSDQYVGSLQEQHFTGSIFAEQRGSNLEGVRGVAGSLSTNDMSISGSLRRVFRLSEDSEVFYDTLLQNPASIANSLAGEVDLSATDIQRVIVNMHYPVDESIDEVMGLVNFAKNTQSTSYGNLLCAGWIDSFPFESKFKDVERFVSRDIGWTKGAELQLFIGAATPPDTDTTGYPNLITGYSPQPYDYITAMSGSANKIYNPRIRKAEGRWVFGDTVAGATGAPAGMLGNGVRHLRNMANVKSDADSTRTGTDGYGSHYRVDDVQTYRLFTAAMLGYGRANRKYLDIRDYAKAYSLVWGTTGDAPVEADFDHPAGFKFGYMNCDHISPSQVYRANRYGQFRDMLEQRLYSKTYSKTSDFSPKGEGEPAVSCIFVDRSGTPVEDSTTTSCLNLSTAMTASKPFIDGDPPRTVILNTDFISIDAFSIDLPRIP